MDDNINFDNMTYAELIEYFEKRDKQIRLLREAREKEIMDQRTREKTAREAGKKEGLKEGIAKGRKEILEKCIAKGKEEAVLMMVKNFLKLGLSIEKIAEATQISVDRVKEIEKNMEN